MQTNAHAPSLPAHHHSVRELLPARLQPFVQELLARYGTTAELRRDLQGESYCRISELASAFGPTPDGCFEELIGRRLSESISCYVREFWDEAGLATEAATPAEFAPGNSSAEAGGLRLLSLPAEGVRHLSNYLVQLPHRQRLAFVWGHYDGYSDEEIAERLAVDSETARALLRQAVRSLRRLIERDAGD